MTPYERLPTIQGAYPPSRWTSPRRLDRRIWLSILSICAGLVFLLHFAILGAFPTSAYTQLYRPHIPASSPLPVPSITISSDDIYNRDAYPIRSMLDFWQLAEAEISQHGLDTCNDKLGRSLIDAYHRHRITYLKPTATGGSEISCAQVKYDQFSEWWPVPAAPCLSTKLRANERGFQAYLGNKTEEGEKMDREMSREGFVGTDLGQVEENKCGEEVKRTILMIPRQDQWNPFHVAEDMVTTLVSTFIAVQARPELADEPIQIVFNDEFGLEGNHFVPMWDKIGAWPPRRLGLDPWDHACLKTVIHSVTAGMSLLSAQGVGEAHQCASSITWAASHFYRNLFGLRPASPTSSFDKVVHVLWLSRTKFDNWAMKENKWSLWRDSRHISNEPDILRRLRSGLADLCLGCFIDEDVSPGYWAAPSTGRSIRFATLDPSVHSLDTQVHMVGHATILISLHGGALGLSMFMQPGQGTILELTVPETSTSKHFQTMSAQLGLSYESMLTSKVVDLEDLWTRVERLVSRRENAIPQADPVDTIYSAR